MWSADIHREVASTLGTWSDFCEGKSPTREKKEDGSQKEYKKFGSSNSYHYLCIAFRKKAVFFYLFPDRVYPYHPLGEFQSGQMGQTVNLLSLDFGGSNPSSPTTQQEASTWGASCCFQSLLVVGKEGVGRM